MDMPRALRNKAVDPVKEGSRLSLHGPELAVAFLLANAAILFKRAMLVGDRSNEYLPSCENFHSLALQTCCCHLEDSLIARLVIVSDLSIEKLRYMIEFELNDCAE